MGEVKSVYCLELVHSDTSKNLSLYPGKLASDISIDGKKYNLSLNSLSFSKRVYEPCHVKADIKIALGSGTTALPGFDKSVGYFASFSSVSLKIGNIEASGPGGHSINYKGDVGTVGTGYVIMDTQPLYRTGGGLTAMSVTLEIYSPDYFFTRREYSQTYTGKRLSDLIDTAITDFGLKDTLQVSHDYLSYLSYIDANDKKTKRELIQPYLVQYNESFYEMIARTANRCGEWLYFEDGKFYLGWPSDSTKIATTSLSAADILSATFRSRRNEMITDACTFYGRNPATKDSTEPSSWNYNMEMAADEYLAPLTKGQFDDESLWRDLQTHLFAQFVAKMLDCSSLYKGLADYLVNIAKSEATYAQRTKMSNDKNNAAFFEGDAASDNNLEHFNDKPENATTTTPFSTNPSYKNRPSGYTTDIDLALYKKVREVQIELDEKSLDVELGGKLREINVGHIIKISSISDGLYMVTEVTGSDATVGDSRVETMGIRAVPIDSGKKAVFPPARKQDYVPRSGQQTAFITSNSDPLRQGRVRIRFAWEKSDSTGTPWIRMATPFASKDGAGLFISPQEGDEVLVDFAGGNMERPVVVGSLYNSSNLPPYTQHVFQSVFRTPGGHAIKTMDGSDIMSFVGNVIPAIGLLRSFIPYIQSKVSSDSNSAKLLGGMELTDEYGIYRISMDTAKRQISVDSPFGDVKINAYTGISINAPNGDVKIVGKNVSIVANNNLTLMSGKNILNKSVNNAIRTKAASPGEIAVLALKAVFYENLLKKAIDFTLIRTVMETIIKPIEGTLTVKSARFMKLEAGEGNAHIPSTAYARPSVGAFGKREITLRKIAQSIDYINSYTDRVVSEYKTAYNQIVAAKTPLNNLLTMLNANIGDGVKPAAVIQRGLGNNAQDFTMDDINRAVPEEELANLNVPAATHALSAMNELLAIVKNFRPEQQFKPSTLCPESKWDVYIDKIDELYDNLNNRNNYPYIFNSNNETFAQALDLADSGNDILFKKKLSRLLTYKIIDAYKSDAKLRVLVDANQQPTVQAMVQSLNQGMNTTDDHWAIFIRALAPAENLDDNDTQSTKSELFQIFENVPFVPASERNFYRADNSMGRILMADNKDGRTLQIENGAFIQYDNKGYEQVLKQIKKACGVPEVAPPVPHLEEAEEGEEQPDEPNPLEAIE